MDFLHDGYVLSATILADDRLNQYGSLNATTLQFFGILWLSPPVFNRTAARWMLRLRLDGRRREDKQYRDTQDSCLIHSKLSYRRR